MGQLYGIHCAPHQTRTRIMADVKKCCVCCATTWIILATILVAIGIGTDFWYTGIFKMTYTSGGDETTYYRATTYGLEKFCAYPKNFNINAIIDGSAGPEAQGQRHHRDQELGVREMEE